MHLFWITSRAAGIAALLASTAAVALGLMMSTRLRRGADFKPLHEALSLATMVALGVHALALLGDGYLKPLAGRRHAPVRLLVRAAVDDDGHRRRLDARDPRALLLRAREDRPGALAHLHRFTALAWVLGIVHAIGEGTDAGTPLFLLTAAALILPTAALLARRLAPAT